MIAKQENVMWLAADDGGRYTAYTKGGNLDIQRLRNLTTGRLHTEMSHIYEDLGIITGEKGLMTHMLPRACRAINSWLRDNVSDPRFWDGKYDTTHVGEFDLPMPTNENRKVFFERLKAMPNPLFEKKVVEVCEL